MIERIEIKETFTLEGYEAYGNLTQAVRDLREEAAKLVPQLEGRKLWMINSTAKGGGVAEMMPMMISILRQLGLDTDWVVIGTDEMEFFRFTKQMHNLIHGVGEPHIDSSDRELYEGVNRKNAEEFKSWIKPGDVVAIHDPQPMAMMKYLRPEVDVHSIWRCHIGLDDRTPATRTAWKFLEPYAADYDNAVFSAPEYIPDFLAGRSTIIHPALDPLTHKNRDLSAHKLVGVLTNSGLIVANQPVVTPSFEKQVQRLEPDG